MTPQALIEKLRDDSGSHINGLYDRQAADLIERLLALADLMRLADAGWNLPPSATKRIAELLDAMLAQPASQAEMDGQQDGAYMRGFKAAKRQDAGAYDRGVIVGLRQAAAICSDREDLTADRLKAEIEACIAASIQSPA